MRPRPADVIGLAAIQLLVPGRGRVRARIVGDGAVKSRFGPAPSKHWRLALYAAALSTALLLGFFAAVGRSVVGEALPTGLALGLILGGGLTMHFGLSWLMLGLTWRIRP